LVQVHQPGFTIIELLVVISVVGLLMALLVPAVQRSREVARRAECSNHLRQCAVGILSHEETFGWFPTGGWSKRWLGHPDRGAGTDQPGGWIYNLLPFVEQRSIHDLGRGQMPPDAAVNARRTQTALPLLMCPTRRGAELFANSRTYLFCDVVTAVARNDYAMNGGHLTFLYGDGPATFAAATSFAWPDSSSVTGLSFQRSQVRTRDVRDGLSHTYLVAEKHLRMDRYFSGDDQGDNETMTSGDDRDLIRFTGGEFDVTFHPQSDQWIAAQEGLIFGSAHSQGFQAAFADGAVRTMNYSLSQEIHSRLGNRRDGKPVSLGD
jgi:prepilin-type N-terminal cleavage/methylation domain-containing protein